MMTFTSKFIVNIICPSVTVGECNEEYSGDCYVPKHNTVYLQYPDSITLYDIGVAVHEAFHALRDVEGVNYYNIFKHGTIVNNDLDFILASHEEEEVVNNLSEEWLRLMYDDDNHLTEALSPINGSRTSYRSYRDAFITELWLKAREDRLAIINY